MSPLHNVVIRLQYTHFSTVLAVSSTVGRILTAYYECQGLEYLRKVDHLTVSSSRHEQVISAKSSSTPECRSTYSLELQFYDTRNKLVGKIILLFPSERTRAFAAEGLDLGAGDWCIIFLYIKGLLHLRLDRLVIGPVLDALCFDGEGVCGI